MNPIGWAGLLAVVSASTCLGQESPDPARAVDSPRQLDTLAARENALGTPEAYRRALELWTKAAVLYRRDGDPRSEGRTLIEIGRVHRALAFQSTVAAEQRSHEDSALTYLYQALPIAERDTSRSLKGRAFASLGAFYAHADRPDSGLAYFSKALPELAAAGERKLQARSLYGVGRIYLQYVHADSALGYYHQALDIQSELTDARDEQAMSLGSMALAYELLYIPDSALAYYHLQRALFGAMGEVARESRALIDIGTIHQQVGRRDSALAYFRQAFDLTQTGRPDRGGRESLIAEGKALQGIAVVLRDGGRYDSALGYFNRAAASFHQAKDSSWEGTMHQEISSAYLTLGRLDSALAHWQTAGKLNEAWAAAFGRKDTAVPAAAVAGRDSTGEGLLREHQMLQQLSALGMRQLAYGRLSAIGGIHDQQGRLDSARAYYQQALALARNGRALSAEAGDLFQLGSIYWKQARADSALSYFRRALARYRDVGARWNERYALFRIGQVHHRRTDRLNLYAARAYYDSASSVYAAVSADAGGDANRLSLTEQSLELTQSWAQAWLASSRQPGVLRSPAAALAVAERGRAQALLHLMLRSPSEVPGTQKASFAGAQPGADLGAEADALLAPLRTGRTAAITYLVTSDTLILWLLSPSGVLEVQQRPVSRDSLVGLVRSLRGGLGADSARGRMARGKDDRPREQERGVRPSRSSSEAFAKAAAQLSSLILPAAFLDQLPTGSELVLLPHDVLGLVPFAALPVGANEPLGVRYPLRYAPSLSALNAVEAGPQRTRRTDDRTAVFRQALVVGNPEMPSVRDTTGEMAQLTPLPHAGEEAKAVATRLRTTALLRRAATEAAVRARLSRAPLIHLATHGLAHGTEARVRSSYVALAPDAQHDGLFTLGELLDEPGLHLGAALVVLSACQTGLGDMKQAEGTVGLQRAYLAKGAQSVLVSLWSVDDRATRLLMEQFYSHWLDDGDRPSKAEALRRAQNDVRTSTRFGFGDPRYWAAFQLVGAR